MGACHAVELAYIFNNLDQTVYTGEGISKKLADEAQQLWVNFALTGNPSTKDHPWEPYSVRCRKTMIFDDEIFQKINLHETGRRLLYPLLDYRFNGNTTALAVGGSRTLIAAAAAQDVNGNGAVDVEEDHFGMALESLSMVYAVYASGVSLTDKDEDGVPYIDVSEEGATAVLDKYAPFFNNASVTLFADKIGGYSNVFRELFLPSLMENRLLFFSNQLLVALNLREMDSE